MPKPGFKSIAIPEPTHKNVARWSVERGTDMYELATAAWDLYETAVLKKEHKPPCPLCRSTVYGSLPPQFADFRMDMLANGEWRLLRAAQSIREAGDPVANAALDSLVAYVEYLAGKR